MARPFPGPLLIAVLTHVFGALGAGVQLYIDGEFIGGCDICIDMYQSGVSVLG